MNSHQLRTWFRTIEFFKGKSGWYFLSPDGLAVGPYVTERIAEQQAAKLAKTLRRLEGQRTTREAVLEFTIEACAAG
jgi:hypothetical protein